MTNEVYSIRIPITLAPGQKIEIGDGVGFRYDHLRVEMIRELYFYSMTVADFRSEADARAWLGKFSVAVLWIALKFRFGILFESTPSEIQLAPSPITPAPGSVYSDLLTSAGWNVVDGFYSADTTVIRPEHKKLIRDRGGRPTVTIGVPANAFIEGLEEGLRHARPDIVLANTKLRLAIEIYASSFFESSTISRFLVRMMVLEALALPATRPEPLLFCLGSFMDQLDLQRDRLVELCGAREFDSLAGSLRNLREKSIGQKITRLLENTLTDTPEAERISEFKQTYNVRSQLVHNGQANNSELNSAVSNLDVLVPAVLIRLLLQ